MPMTIIEPHTPEHLASAASLFREYAASLPFSLCFQGFEQEVTTLPGRYAPPRGRIFLAYDNNTPNTLNTPNTPSTPVGCIALREIAPGICEMKRMYVQPTSRHRGIGRLLAQRLIEAARAIGYREMRLDSEDNMTAAVTLYRSLGFTYTERYNDDPHPHTIWMKLDLSGTSGGATTASQPVSRPVTRS